MVFFGVLAFALFFLSDWNDGFAHHKNLKLLFPAATLLLTASLLLQLRLWDPAVRFLPVRVLGLVLAVAALALEVDALVFALPRQASYGNPGGKRSVCARGVYALCRHPGVLFFGFLMFFLWLSAGLSAYAAIAYTLMDIALALFEDWLIFPRCMEDYAAYRKVAPFLIPTPASMAQCLKKRT